MEITGAGPDKLNYTIAPYKAGNEMWLRRLLVGRCPGHQKVAGQIRGQGACPG